MNGNEGTYLVSLQGRKYTPFFHPHRTFNVNRVFIVKLVA